MSVTFRLPSSQSIELVGFAWSPLFEAVLSLPVVADPKRSPLHLPWARRTRDLPDDLVTEIRLLRRSLGGFVPGIFEIGLCGDSPVFEHELAAFDRLDPDLVSHELSLGYGGLGCCPVDASAVETVHDPSYRDAVLARAAGTDVEPLARLAFDDPAALRDRYSAMLARYWELAFHREWERLLPRIEAEVTDGARALVIGGLPGLVDELVPEARWDPSAGGIVVEKRHDAVCDVSQRGRLLFVPTVYGWPRVMIELAEPWPPSVIFPLRHLRQPTRPQATDVEVVDTCRALGDQTRLQIARLVAEHPRSTKELASLLSLSDSAISRHLKILDGAGLVSSHRDGYFVLYALRPDRIDTIGRALREALGIRTVSSGDVPRLPVTVTREEGRRHHA